MAPKYPGQSATVLVTLAAMAGIPTAVSMGKLIKVPPPAKAFTRPAAIAARVMRTYWYAVNKFLGILSMRLRC